MPDPTYKTFLSPGSCQLEITDLVATANDDKGVDLYGVAWEIEQVLIAGEGFAASPTDVWVNERGILNVGQSLFDKINRTANDNDNVPGQCTIVVKATSLVDSSKVARLKVLVGYPGESGSGGGGGSTVELPIYEMSNNQPLSTLYFTVEDSSGEQLTITPHSDEETSWFTIEANVGDLLTFRPVDGGGYDFGSNTKYVMISGFEVTTYPLSFSTTEVKIVAANDPNALDPFLMFEFTGTH